MRVAAWCFAAVLFGEAGCDLPAEAELGEGPRVLGSSPEKDERGVERSGAYSIWFDRALLPRDVHRGRVFLQSGARSVFLSPVFDPVDRRLDLVNLGEPLDPDVRYRLRVAAIRDLDGLVMPVPYEVVFETGRGIEPPSAPEVTYADVQPILAGCAAEGCHRPPDPVLGLDLSSPEGIRRTAVGVVAEQSRTGTQSGATYRSVTGLRGLARIEVAGGVGRPSRSYLLYKVLDDPHVVGDRMPPAPAPPLDAAAMSTLSRWIFQGAPTD